MPDKLLIAGGLVIDVTEAMRDVYIENGRIAEVGPAFRAVKFADLLLQRLLRNPICRSRNFPPGI